MHIVGRIQVPSTTDVSGLYIKCYEGASINLCEGCREVTFLKDGVVSLNSYFNSLYAKFYAKYTELCSLYYLLKLEGDFQVSIYKETYAKENRELISIETLEKCHISDNVKITLPNISQNDNPGRVYLEIICLSECGLFTGGLIVTDKPPTRKVCLSIITCTFKKEAFIKKTIQTILEDSFLTNKEFKIFVVDNGKTLNADEFSDRRVQTIPNKNVGGSGGFTRGLLEALGENKYTHFLLMDDDIELDSESIYRLFSLYEYAKHDFAVAGSKLDLYKKHILDEVGGLYGKCSARRNKDNPFSVALIKHNLDLQDATFLNFLLVEEDFDYGGFWFFSFSIEIIKEIGLPMPFFIQRDDIEFCLRIKERFGDQIVAFPSIAVWHEPPYAKNPVWLGYYWCRNNLITYSIHRSLGYVDTVKYITKSIIISLLFFDYIAADMLVKAFEDYMKGPDFIINNEASVLHSNIINFTKIYQRQNLQVNYSLDTHFYHKSNVGSLKKLVSLLTLNGHLLPNFITSNCDAFVRIGPNYSLAEQWYNVLPKTRVVFFKEENARFHQNEIDKLAGVKILTKWFQTATVSSVKWSFITAEWKKASRELTSNEFWQQYLELKK